MHDTPSELGQPFEPKDWKKASASRFRQDHADDDRGRAQLHGDIY